MKKITICSCLFLFIMLSSYIFPKPTNRNNKRVAKNVNFNLNKEKQKEEAVKITEFLKSVEGVKYKAYKDNAGYYTIGCGHKILSTENYLLNVTLTNVEVDNLLLNDLKSCENAINKLVKVSLTENQKVALKSFCFNNGINAFKKSTLLKKINSKSPKNEINDEFQKWVKVKKEGKLITSSGLQKRRIKEANLFLK